MQKIGLLVGRENTFPPAFIEHVNARNAGITAEYCKLGGTRLNEPSDYAVIIDRLSHEVPYYRSYLKNAALEGAVVINEPNLQTSTHSRQQLFVELGYYSNAAATAHANFDDVVVDWP